MLFIVCLISFGLGKIVSLFGRLDIALIMYIVSCTLVLLYLLNRVRRQMLGEANAWPWSNL
jgi:hypothetical protein